MKLRALILTAALATPALCPAAVSVIGLNFAGRNSHTVAPGEAAGAPEFRQENWNNLTGDFGGAGGTGGIVEQTGAGIGITVFYDAPNAWSTEGLGAGADRELMAGYLDSNNGANGGTNLGSFGNQPYVAVTGLPASYAEMGYKIVVYSDGGGNANRGGLIWAETFGGDVTNHTGTTISDVLEIRDNATFSGTYTEATSGSTSGNYLVLGPIYGETSFVIRTQELNFRIPINAIQIVTPEPSRAALLLIGVAALALRRRR
ncbi:MAG: PEP-CTERM sorting domain-containing protein [Verrucomicrobiales bacterium]